MKRINFKQLPQYKDRCFVPLNADFKDSEIVKSLYENLLGRKISCLEEFVQWFQDFSELEIVFDEFGSKLYIEMTCQTDDEELSNKYKSFVENIIPVVKDYEDKLNKKYLELSSEFSSGETFYTLYQRDIRSDIEIFVKENIALETKIQLLSQEYQETLGAMAVQWEGEEKTLIALSKLLLIPDRDLRKKVWEAINERRSNDRDKINHLFDEMLSLRNAISQNAGFSNFSQYKFKELHRFDYTIEKCKEYHQAIEGHVVPLWKEILNKRRDQMRLDSLRPWDTTVDPLGRPPLAPFHNVEQLVEGCKEILTKIDPDFGSYFSQMADEGYLDLDNRKGKAPGGYQSSLNEARKPFIFMNAVGTDSDVKTLLHESGHAIHSLLCSSQPILHYLHAPMEFCEVASMTMEMLCLNHLSVFYENKADEKRSIINHLEDVIFILVWVATIDAFQHWIYENPNQTIAEREDAWIRIRNRFAGDVVDWSGYEKIHKSLWHKQLHIFEVPLYYIEYGIAQLGALQIWLRSKEDYAHALVGYKKSLALGGSQTLPELFKSAGIHFGFSTETIEPLVKEVQRELENLWQ